MTTLVGTTTHSAARSAAHEDEKVEFALQAGAASPHRATGHTSYSSNRTHHTFTIETYFSCSEFINYFSWEFVSTPRMVRRSRTCL
jgi:hypothetical protein